MPADFPDVTGRLLAVSWADDESSRISSATAFHTIMYKLLTNALSGL
jgi:hypothetical protein